MLIGFIGFGRVSYRLNELFTQNNFKTVTAIENRSTETIERIRNSNIGVLNSNKELFEKSDILISANSPLHAVKVAKNHGKYCKGTYIDLNNISRETTLEIAEYIPNFIDGAIIGKIERDRPILYLAGNNLERLSFLNDLNIDVHLISDNIGDASNLKLLRSTYTKSLAGVLIESLNLARSLNLENEFLKTLELTEGEINLSRVENTLKNRDRKVEELEEILSSFSSENLIILKAVLESFKNL